MARFLLPVWPLVGHLYPEAGIAQALQARGHAVMFYTGASMRPRLEAAGFEVCPFERISEQLVHDVVRSVESQPVGWRAPRHFASVLRQWWVETIPGQVEDLAGLVRQWQPDVMVVDPAMWGPIIVLWETTGIPVAVSSYAMGCFIPGPDAPPWGPGLPPPRNLQRRLLSRAVTTVSAVTTARLRRRVDEIRAQYRLPPLGSSVNAFTARLPLYLVHSIPALDYNRRDLPTSVHYVGPCTWDRPTATATSAAASAWLAQVPADTLLVHATEGTLHHRDPFLLRATAQGLANHPAQVILTTGPQRDQGSINLGPLAANIHLEEWVSYADLLPRCAAVITTGGAGTVMAALREGVPLVVVPTHWDKPDNAQRVVEAGVGVRLSPSRCTPTAVRAAVERVLGDPRFRENARRIAAELQRTNGPERAADLLGNLAGRDGGDNAR